MRRKSRKMDPENGMSSYEPEENRENDSEDDETNVVTEDAGDGDVKKAKSPRKNDKSPKKSTKNDKKSDRENAESEERENGADDDEVTAESGERESKRRKVEKKTSKSPKKSKGNKKGAKTQDEDTDEQYEVEAIINSKTVRGVKHYLIRWKGYDASSDTWESEVSLNCPDRIKEYNESLNKKSSTPSSSPKKRGRKKNESNSKKQNTSLDEDSENEENAEYEVDRIIEVHHKRNGKKEFLVSWKGYPPSQDSWVSEEDMDCKDLIAKFMAKVERAKNATPKQLRENRAQTDRFTLTTREHGRRLSRRNQGKQRVQYHNTE